MLGLAGCQATPASVEAFLPALLRGQGIPHFLHCSIPEALYKPAVLLVWCWTEEIAVSGRSPLIDYEFAEYRPQANEEHFPAVLQ